MWCVGDICINNKCVKENKFKMHFKCLLLKCTEIFEMEHQPQLNFTTCLELLGGNYM